MYLYIYDCIFEVLARWWDWLESHGKSRSKIFEACHTKKRETRLQPPSA